MRAYVLVRAELRAETPPRRMADFVRRDTAQLLRDVPEATREAVIGALEIALENRDWTDDDRDDVCELLKGARVDDAEQRCHALAAAIGLVDDASKADQNDQEPAGVDDGDQEPAWVDVAAKLFVVCAVCAVARVARDDLSWSGMATAAALAAAAYALRGETLGDNEHPETF